MKSLLADLNQAYPIRPYLRQQPVVAVVGALAVFPWVLIVGWNIVYVAIAYYLLGLVTAYLVTARRLARRAGR